MLSFSKRTLIPNSFSRRMVFSKSSVFLAKRDIDLVKIMLIFPASQSSSIRWNSSRLPAFVPVMLSSA